MFQGEACGIQLERQRETEELRIQKIKDKKEREEQLKRLVENKLNNMASERYVASMTKPCPKCNSPLMKIEG